MANFIIDFYSNSLMRPVQFKMIIPNDFNERWEPEQKRKGKRMKTLFLLHGYTGAAGNWVPEHLATLYNFAIVMPNGENAFWVDGISTGHKYGTFIGVELVEYLRKTFNLCMDADETYIMGISMGGFGALRAALAYPETFGKAVALSPALIMHSRAHMKPGDLDEHANYEYYRECFGDLEVIEQSRNNPEVLTDEIIAEGTKMPDIYIAIGREDFLLERNRSFHEFLDSRNVTHRYFESEGGHDSAFWDSWTPKLIELMFEEADIRLLTKDNFTEFSLDTYERRQDVKKVYRKINDEYVLVEQPYVEDWDLERRRQIASEISSDEYITYIAMNDKKVVGFIGLIKELHGDRMILDLMHVSAGCRGAGIGRRLFEMGKKEALKAGAKELYISACSSEETIAFYRAMGAEITDSPIKEMAEEEPFDLQLVCKIR